LQISDLGVPHQIVQAEFVVDEVVLGQVFLLVFSFFGTSCNCAYAIPSFVIRPVTMGCIPKGMNFIP
jgi:hypothetical protein